MWVNRLTPFQACSRSGEEDGEGQWRRTRRKETTTKSLFVPLNVPNFTATPSTSAQADVHNPHFASSPLLH